MSEEGKNQCLVWTGGLGVRTFLTGETRHDAPSRNTHKHNPIRKGGSLTSEKCADTEEVVDMELQCVRCKAQLYIPVSQASAVIASIERTGAAILICVCGQAQLIRSRRQKRND